MNPVLAEMAPSPIRRMNQLKQPGDMDLGLGEPTWPVPEDLVDVALDAVRRLGTAYGPNAGLAEVREALARARGGHWQDRGAAAAILTVGAQEAVATAMGTLLAPGDELLVVTPAYPLYQRLAEWLGISCRTVAMPAATGFAPDPERILRAVGPKTRLVVLGQPGNPTGRALDEPGLEMLCRGLERHEARPWLLSDEVYRDLPAARASLPTAIDHGARVLVAGSLSKSHAATGWRIGWLLGPPDVLAGAGRLHQLLVTSTGIPGQRLLEAVCHREAWQRSSGASRDRWQMAEPALVHSGLRHIVPDGGFFTLVQPTEGALADSDAAAHAVLERARIVTIPGAAFAAEGWLRISLLAPSDRLAPGLVQLARCLAEISRAG
ncbi:MAG: pyridoxal phosphate-dependent aminotransferase [Candidatus Sericytochromatia bacterium]|nr:pyridoxal phosphate-dependent aminotransferase [Candidatus Tanganyikabacteria bacterium]